MKTTKDNALSKFRKEAIDKILKPKRQEALDAIHYNINSVVFKRIWPELKKSVLPKYYSELIEDKDLYSYFYEVEYGTANKVFLDCFKSQHMIDKLVATMAINNWYMRKDRMHTQFQPFRLMEDRVKSDVICDLMRTLLNHGEKIRCNAWQYFLNTIEYYVDHKYKHRSPVEYVKWINLSTFILDEVREKKNFLLVLRIVIYYAKDADTFPISERDCELLIKWISKGNGEGPSFKECSNLKKSFTKRGNLILSQEELLSLTKYVALLHLMTHKKDEEIKQEYTRQMELILMTYYLGAVNNDLWLMTLRHSLKANKLILYSALKSFPSCIPMYLRCLALNSTNLTDLCLTLPMNAAVKRSLLDRGLMRVFILTVLFDRPFTAASPDPLLDDIELSALDGSDEESEDALSEAEDKADVVESFGAFYRVFPDIVETETLDLLEKVAKKLCFRGYMTCDYTERCKLLVSAYLVNNFKRRIKFRRLPYCSLCDRNTFIDPSYFATYPFREESFIFDEDECVSILKGKDDELMIGVGYSKQLKLSSIECVFPLRLLKWDGSGYNITKQLQSPELLLSDDSPRDEVCTYFSRYNGYYSASHEGICIRKIRGTQRRCLYKAKYLDDTSTNNLELESVWNVGSRLSALVYDFTDFAVSDKLILLVNIDLRKVILKATIESGFTDIITKVFRTDSGVAACIYTATESEVLVYFFKNRDENIGITVDGAVIDVCASGKTLVVSCVESFHVFTIKEKEITLSKKIINPFAAPFESLIFYSPTMILAVGNIKAANCIVAVDLQYPKAFYFYFDKDQQQYSNPNVLIPESTAKSVGNRHFQHACISLSASKDYLWAKFDRLDRNNSAVSIIRIDWRNLWMKTFTN